MQNLLDTMFIKRFCLPMNANIECYENGIDTVPACVCGQYNHVSCILQGKWQYEKG
jgi:hypothetical protein